MSSILRTKFFYIGKPPLASGTLGLFAEGITAPASYKYNFSTDVVTVGPNPAAATGTIASFASAVSNSTTAVYARNRTSSSSGPVTAKYSFNADVFNVGQSLIYSSGNAILNNNASTSSKGYFFFYSTGGPTVYTYSGDTMAIGGVSPITMSVTFSSYSIASPTFALVGVGGSSPTQSIKYTYSNDTAVTSTNFLTGNTFSAAFGNSLAGYYYGGANKYTWANDSVTSCTAISSSTLSAAMGNANLAIVAQKTLTGTFRYTYISDVVNAASSLPTGISNASGTSNGIAGVSA